MSRVESHLKPEIPNPNNDCKCMTNIGKILSVLKNFFGKEDVAQKNVQELSEAERKLRERRTAYLFNGDNNYIPPSVIHRCEFGLYEFRP